MERETQLELSIERHTLREYMFQCRLFACHHLACIFVAMRLLLWAGGDIYQTLLEKEEDYHQDQKL